jgi:hypothetical protein
MLNLLFAYYKIHPFTPKVDEVLSLIAKFESNPQPMHSGLKMLPQEQFNLMSKSDFSNWVKGRDLEFDGLKQEYELIKLESEKHLKNVKSMYLDNIDCEKMKGFQYSLQDLNYHMGATVLALNRLWLIYQPEYTYTTATHSRSKIEYDMIKGNWYEDDGEKKRTINRNLGSTGIESEDIVAKMYESLGFETFRPSSPMGNGIKVDLVISKGGKKWIVEVKIKDRRSFAESFASMEVWKKYKSVYGI